MSALPPIRPDLSLTEGYHSPQVEAEVRLNTNESPFPPPEGWSRDLLAALAEVEGLPAHADSVRRRLAVLDAGADANAPAGPP